MKWETCRLAVGFSFSRLLAHWLFCLTTPLFAAMPPKGRRNASTNKSERFVEVMATLTQQAADAKKNLKEVRKAQRNDKQRRKRIIKAASKLAAPELMEIAGLKKITLEELSRLVTEMHVPLDEAQKTAALAREGRARNSRATSSASHGEPAPAEGHAPRDEAAESQLLPIQDEDVPTEPFAANEHDAM